MVVLVTLTPVEYLARVVDAFRDTSWCKSDAGVSLTEMSVAFLLHSATRIFRNIKERFAHIPSNSRERHFKTTAPRHQRASGWARI
jgi:hypothetical protein